uniref:Uncharacterized protein n=1 Tax=Anguilla anguilla TaxID=7936 RepID=A0A0E9URY7_ANGAN
MSSASVTSQEINEVFSCSLSTEPKSVFH